jgi:alpha-1,2-mannosyltransferase
VSSVAPAAPRRVLGPTGAVALAAVAAALGLVVNAVRIATASGGDFEVYRVLAPTVFREGALYEMHLGELGFTYPAFAALPLSLFSLIGRELGLVLMTLLSLAALARVCHLLARAVLRERPSLAMSKALLALSFFALALWLNPVMQTLDHGQVNLLLMWLIVEDLIGDVPRRFRGVLIGLATGIKLTPALFIVGLFVAGARTAAARATAVFLGTVVIGALAEPTAALGYWTNLGDSSAFGNTIGRWNQSLVYGLSRVTGDPHLYFIPLAVFVLIVAVVTAARLFALRRDLAGWGVLAAAALVASPISWNHHWVLMAVPMAAMLAMAGTSPGARRLLGATTVVMALGLMWIAPKIELTGATWDAWAWLPGNAFIVMGLASVAWFAWVALTAEPDTTAPDTTAPDVVLPDRIAGEPSSRNPLSEDGARLRP